MTHWTWTALAVTTVLLLPLPALAAFQCPAADPANAGETPVLSPSDVADGYVSDALKSTIHRMLATGVKSGKVIDTLVIADCARIDAEPNFSDDRKAEQVRKFATKVANFIYDAPAKSADDIVLDVPIPAALYERLRQAAQKAGMSENVWLHNAITRKLAAP